MTTATLPPKMIELMDVHAQAILAARPFRQTRYPTDPIEFVRDILGHDIWWTPEALLRAIAKPNASVAVKGCHGSSKTFTAAEIVLWWVYGMNGIALTTAPVHDQVRTQLWGEIHKARETSKRPLPGHVTQTSLTYSRSAYAIGRTSSHGVRFQGYHGERILIIVDEDPGVGEDIQDAIEGIRSGGDARVLRLGNPVIPSGPFYDIFSANRSTWQTLTIDAFDTPNLKGLTPETIATLPDDELDIAPRPYLVRRRWVRDRLTEWGETDPRWASRVRGEFPTESEWQLISLTWLEQAKRREPVAVGENEPIVAGLDVAGPGESETSLTVRQGPNILAIQSWPHADPRGEVLNALRRWNVRQCNVDTVGQGYYMARHLADNGIAVRDVNVGDSPRNRERYGNLKAELYWGLRERFTSGDVTGLADDTAISQLASIQYEHNSRGQVVIESKDKARARGVKSPDRAEGLMLAFASVGITGDIGWVLTDDEIDDD